MSIIGLSSHLILYSTLFDLEWLANQIDTITRQILHYCISTIWKGKENLPNELK